MSKQPTRETQAQKAAREERERQDANATRRAEAEAAASKAQADAEARRAEAQARSEQIKAEAEATRLRAEADTARMRAETDAAKRKADAEDAARKAAEAKAPFERLYQLGINTAAPALGYIGGVQLAKHLGGKHAAGVAAANKQLKAIGSSISKALPKTGAPKAATIAKLAGYVKAADALKLAGRPAAVGLATAGILLAEGAFSRFVLGPQADKIDPTAGEAVRAVGTASLFAATTLVGKRIMANATTTALPDAKSLAAVETARKMIPAVASGAAPSVATRAAAVLKVVPKSKSAAVALAVAGVGAIAATMTGQANAAPAGPVETPAPSAPDDSKSGLYKAADIALSTATTLTAAKLVASSAARAGAGILARLSIPVTAGMAVAGGMKGYAETGTIGGAAEGAADMVTGGGYSAIKSMVQRAVAPPAQASGSLALMQGAAMRTAGEMGKASTLSGGGSAVSQASPDGPDGQTEAYTRTQDGRRVFVRGYSTPSR